MDGCFFFVVVVVVVVVVVIVHDLNSVEINFSLKSFQYFFVRISAVAEKNKLRYTITVP